MIINALAIKLFKEAMKAEKYLTRKGQYAPVLKQGGYWANRLVVMKALANELKLSRYGLVVSKRVGKAVVRNRVKRQLREVLRQTPLKSGWDIVFIARPAAATARYADIDKMVRGLLSQAQLLMKDNEEACLRLS